MKAGRGMAVVAVGLLLAGCAGDREAPRLMNLRAQGSGPDEFAILPTRPLEMPADMASLPQPEPGTRNLVDPTPLDDAVVALGGRPGAGGGDGALVAAAGGGAGNIRDQLAAEDAAFRARQRPKLLERLFGTSTYHAAYARQSLRPDPELQRWRQADRRTPSATPPYDR